MKNIYTKRARHPTKWLTCAIIRYVVVIFIFFFVYIVIPRYCCLRRRRHFLIICVNTTNYFFFYKWFGDDRRSSNIAFCSVFNVFNLQNHNFLFTFYNIVNIFLPLLVNSSIFFFWCKDEGSYFNRVVCITRFFIISSLYTTSHHFHYYQFTIKIRFSLRYKNQVNCWCSM